MTHDRDEIETLLLAMAAYQRLGSPAERRELRLRCGVGANDLARTIGSSRRSIHRYESSEQRPTGTVLIRYVEFLDAARNLLSKAHEGDVHA